MWVVFYIEMQSTEQDFQTISETPSKDNTSSETKEDSDSDNDNQIEPNNSFDSVRIRREERAPSVIIHDVVYEKKLTPRSKSPTFGENADYSQEKTSPSTLCFVRKLIL